MSEEGGNIYLKKKEMEGKILENGGERKGERGPKRATMHATKESTGETSWQ